MGTFLAALKTVITNKLQTTTTTSRRIVLLPPSTPPFSNHATPTLPSHSTFDYDYSDPKSPYRNPHNTPQNDGLPPSSAAATAPSRFKLHPLDLLLRMSPLALVQCVVYAYWSGEMERVASGAHLHVNARLGGAGAGVYGSRRTMCLALLGNGWIAFGLNVVSFEANKRTGPLTMTVAGRSSLSWPFPVGVLG